MQRRKGGEVERKKEATAGRGAIPGNAPYVAARPPPGHPGTRSQPGTTIGEGAAATQGARPETAPKAPQKGKGEEN
eukprot:12287981-Alexandrium_andersonii.AAC.1